MTMIAADGRTKLRAEVTGVRTEPYLLTIDADHSAHCGVVAVDWDGPDGTLRVPAPSRWPASLAAGLTRVTLVWPPVEERGYSLIVDGNARDDGDAATIIVAITRAVWHRPGVGPDGAACGSDCRPILGKGAA